VPGGLASDVARVRRAAAAPHRPPGRRSPHRDRAQPGHFVHEKDSEALASVIARARRRQRQASAAQCAAFEIELWDWLRSLDPHTVVRAVEATRVATFIRAHLNERLTLERLASVSGWPSRHLSRRFRQHHGVGVQEYIRRQRVMTAAGFVRRGEKIEWVAEAVGYRNRTHFNEAFRRHTGLTPIQYKRQAGVCPDRHRTRRAS
jgi:transcriptional regulator GlxA family with amidase domain